MEPSSRTSLLAATVAGLPTLLAFFVWHWYNIAPTWGVLIEAAVAFPIAVVGIAWAWRVARGAGRLPGASGGLAFASVFVAGVVLAEAIGFVRGRNTGPMDAAAIATEAGLAAFTLLPAVAVGWRIARGRGAGAFAVAALPLDLHLGGTVLHLGGRGPALLLASLLVGTYLLAGLILARLAPEVPGAAVPPGAPSLES